MTPAAVIVIVNYNSGDHLVRALASIRAHAPTAETVVIDNASNDGSEQRAVGVPRVTLVRHATNAGFAAGVNLGARTAAALGAREAPLLLINPDGVLTAGALDRLLQELVQHGVTVADRVPHIIPPNEFNRFYLETKRDRSGHMLDHLGKPHVPEQGEDVRVG